jgi:hypothetical protein
MMKRAGCAIAVVGLLLVSGSFGFFGTSIFRAIAAHEAAKARIEVGSTFDSGLLTVDSSKLVQVAIAAEVYSRSVRGQGGTDGGFAVQFGFPFRYTAFDEAGNVLFEESAVFDSNGATRGVTSTGVSADGGSEWVEKGFAKFAVAPPGALRVVAHLEEDGENGARLGESSLLVYDRVSRHGRRIAAGVASLLLGGLATLTGGTLYLFARLKRGTSASPIG